MAQSLESGEPDCNMHDGKQALEFLQRLGYSTTTASRHIELTLSFGFGLDLELLGKAARLAENTELLNFTSNNPVSGSLFVNGNEDMSIIAGASPISLVSARIAKLSQTVNGVYSLSFFCVEHRPYGNFSCVPPPEAIMLNLVGQLVQSLAKRLGETDLGFIGKKRCAELELLDLKALCQLFYDLIDKIPDGSVVFCIIDAIDSYDLPEFREDVDTILRRLTRKASTGGNITFKLLATCRGRSLSFDANFNMVVDIDGWVPADDQWLWKVEQAPFFSGFDKCPGTD